MGNYHVAKKPSKSGKLSLYSNLSDSKGFKHESASKKYAHYLASLPKNPIKRFINHLKPKNFFRYWFSKRGLITSLKIIGVTLLLLVLFIGGLFVYFRKDIDAIRPGELSKNVQSTVNTYLDRNGQTLWEDKGEGDYKLVVDGSELSKYLKDATVAIEDRDFYNHNGISISGILRAFFNNLSGGSTQGGSTLTQQLVKQVFFADEAQQRGLSGIPRKIKELVLSVEVERMYNKEQILDLYLNESPYGGRRNGAESGSQTYFGKAAKDLTLPEAALLAAIPQNPSVYNPYNIAGHDALIARQHTVLDNMADQGYITKAQAEEAKQYPIIDHLVPEANQYTNIKAPHFVQMVKSQLEGILGKSTVGKGGLTITTTLDLRIQNKLEEAMNDLFNSSLPKEDGFSNGAATVEDTKTGQIVALMGSRDYNWPGFGQDNAATSFIQPGSTIKPFVYTKLFEQKPAGQMNYGSGTILKDENIDALYGASLNNWDNSFKGNITIRSGLATSRNIPAVKAMYISGVQPTLDTIHTMGVTSYCTQGADATVGLASAIGGCGLRQIDLVNGYATIARQGVYKPQSIVLEVKNKATNETLRKWSDVAGDQVVDPQTTYIISDILSDNAARTPLYGSNARGMLIPGVRTGAKTGTSDKNGKSKDLWMVNFSPALVMGIWIGNPDTTILKHGTSSIPGPVIGKVIEYAHKTVYASEGLWKPGDWYSQPSGIQKVGSELYPSWWNSTQGQSTTKMTFDQVSKRKATEFTPDNAKIELDVIKFTDPITKKDAFIAPDGYDASQDDNVHLSTTIQPTITLKVNTVGNTSTITATVTPGTFAVTSVQAQVGDTQLTATSNYVFTYTSTTANTSEQTVTASVIDSGLYKITATATIPKHV